MAATVKFYIHNKRTNSTLQPDPEYAVPYTVDCDFFEPFDLMSPTIILPAIQDAAPIVYNYAYIQDLGRYYFVRDWSYTKGRWFAALNVDVLASWKNQIGTQKPYIMRASNSAAFNRDIIDDLYPAKAAPYILQADPDANGERWYNMLQSGAYVLSIVNDDNRTGGGGLSYYALNTVNFRAFREALFSNNAYMGISSDEISAELSKALVNPAQYISACKWIPVDYSNILGQSLDNIHIGWWTISAHCKLMAGVSQIDQFNWDFAVPERYDGQANWRYACHLSHYNITLPCYGIVEYPAQFVSSYDQNIKVRVDLDCMTGDCTYRIYTTALNPVLMYSANVGVEIPISISQRDLLSTAGNALGSVQQLLTGGDAFGQIVSGVKNYQPTVSVLGSESSWAKFITRPRLTATYYEQIAQDPDHFGHACDIHGTAISTLSGYIQCKEADITINAPLDEKQRIEQYLLSGFYYE